MAGAPTIESGVKSANRALDIFELLAASSANGLTISEISDQLGIARSSTHGLVQTLYRRGYLASDASGRFTLGVRLIQLGMVVSDRLEYRSVARTHLEQLVSSTQDTALFVVASGGDLVFVDKVISDVRNVRTDPRDSVGTPLHSSSLGKALLATIPPEQAEAIVGHTLPALTEFTITDLDELLSDLAAIRARGYSIDRQEVVLGVWCVGAPIRDHSGRAFGAISVSTIKEFFDPAASGPLVAKTAVDISRAMGWDGDVDQLYDFVAGTELLLMPDGTMPEVRG